MIDKKKIEDQIAELQARVDKLESLMGTHKHDYSELTGTIPQDKLDLDEIYTYINRRQGNEIRGI